jgi:hypothetical protein
MPTNENISINPDSQLVILHVKIRGVETESEVVRDEQEGRRHETERNITRTVRDTREYKEAQRLQSLVRGYVKNATVHTPLGNISDTKKVERLREQMARAEVQIASFNMTAEHHPLSQSLLVLPIAAALGPEACRALCEEVTGALDKVVAALRAGDVESVRSWRMRNRNLDSLMPEVIAGALRSAMGVIGDAQRELVRQLKGGALPETAGAALALADIDVVKSLVLPSQTAVAA